MARSPAAAGVRMLIRLPLWLLILMLIGASALGAVESPFLYGIHDQEAIPEEYISHIRAGVPTAWVTATVAVGHDPNDQSGYDFSWFEKNGCTVICRLNNGYFPNGTIPRPAEYANFAQRCANFVRNSRGCEMWLIGNETNMAGEWPSEGSHLPFVSPQDYAACFRQCYNAIKAVAPGHRVITQGLAPFSGPFSAYNMGGYTYDANPYSWVDYMNAMLSTIKSTGGVDGIGLHVYSRGYGYYDIHNTTQISVGDKHLYKSFYVYKDWINFGIPSNMYNLPLYITECNGYFYWKGGHPENPSTHYVMDFVHLVYQEIERYNRETAIPQAKPVIRCVNMYRWAPYDGWNIDGSDNPYKSDILTDLDGAVRSEYTWPGSSTVAGAWRDDFSDSRLDEDFPEPEWSSLSEAGGRYEEIDGWLKLIGQSGQPSRVVVRNDFNRFYQNFIINTKLTLTDTTSTDASTPEARIWLKVNRYNVGYALCFECGEAPNHISIRRTDTWEVVQNMRVERSLPSGTTIYTKIEFENSRMKAWMGTSEGSSDLAYWEVDDSTFTKGCFWLENYRMQELRFDYFAYQPLEAGLQGTVRDSLGSTMAGVTVTTSTGGYSTITGPDGAYAIREMTPATYSVTASKANFKSQTASASVTRGMTNLDFTLTDATKPDTPVVTDGGVYQTSSNSMAFSWASADPESGIVEYRCAIGKSTSLLDLIPGGEWQSVGTATTHTRTGLSLQNGQTYYIFVRARNGANLTSLNGISDGIKIAKGAASVGQAKGEANGVLVALEDEVVTASLSDCTYIQDLSRAGGMRVETTGLAEGSLIDVAGYLTTVDGERRLTVYSIRADGSALLSPLGLRAKAFGGDALNAYTPSLVLYNGPHNSGLLVKSWGRVKEVGAGWFTMSDGSVSGLKVVLPSGVIAPAADSLVSATGISAIENGAGTLTPILRIRRQDDIRGLD